ncbi:penicillin acylase family protein [Kitasatospora sp. LaBMicrA B282]|uniref:penicillin acylase family protein n=1 Tax=Kitasatospora sp. LaBMicrA B282 TaxID=3420949 RepID=UPI003D12CFC7
MRSTSLRSPLALLRRLGLPAVVLILLAWLPPVAAGAAAGSPYRATIVRTAYGIPHITAGDYGSLGYGYGFAFATDDLCTMADDYVTVEAERSRYFGPDGSYDQGGGSRVDNLDSDLYWKSVGDSGVVARMLSVRSGPSAVLPQVRQLMAGYVAGYDAYLASVGGASGVPDPTCRGQAWVRPITLTDAYLRIYQLTDIVGTAGDPGGWTGAQPPTPAPAPAAAPAAAGRPDIARLAAALAADRSGAPGSNALAIGSAGTRDGGPGILLGNPHLPWAGAERLYEVQLTIPGRTAVEGATLFGEPLVAIGFNGSVAWSHTDTPSFPMSLVQLTLVPGHPTEYRYDGRTVPMIRQTETVLTTSASGRPVPVSRTLWTTRWGPVIQELEGVPLPWSATSAFVLEDADATDSRFLNDLFATDEATDTGRILAGEERYEGNPWVDTVAADAQGHALYSDVGNFPDVTDALAQRCDTPLGADLFARAGMPILDGSDPSCGWGTDADSVVPGIFGANEEPKLGRSDYVENSNMSYWLSNASDPLTGYPRFLGLTGVPVSLRTRSALAMVTERLAGTDGLGPAGFTLQGVQDLMYSDLQYGAELAKPQLVASCEALPGGLAPTSGGGEIAVGDACRALAEWNDREDADSRGALLFRDFWERALELPEGPWSTPFDAGRPLTTPSGLDTGDRAVDEAFGDALGDLKAAGIPYDAPLGSRQYVVRDGVQLPISGGPGDPDGEFNAIYQDVLGHPGADPEIGSSYIQAVTWQEGSSCPVARTVLTYSLSADPTSPFHADQTRLFAQHGWVDAPYCTADVLAQARSVRLVSQDRLSSQD